MVWLRNLKGKVFGRSNTRRNTARAIKDECRTLQRWAERANADRYRC